jgi:hypothetical protein
MNDLDIAGGNGGGSAPLEVVTRTDLKLIERACNEGKFPLDADSDGRLVKAVLDIAENAKSYRLRIAASKVLVAMKKTNISIDELNAPKKIQFGNVPGEVFKTYLGIDPSREPGDPRNPST